MPPSPTVVLIIIVVIIIALTVIYWKLPASFDPRFASYVQMLSVIGIVLAVITFLYTSSFQASQIQHFNLFDEQSITGSGWIDLEKQFMANPNLLRLYKQMYRENIPLQSIPDPPVTDAVRNAEIHMSQIIFQNIDNINSYVTIPGGSWKDPTHYGWLRSFRSWFQSDILREQWQYNKQFYDVQLNDFVNNYLLPPTLNIPSVP